MISKNLKKVIENINSLIAYLDYFATKYDLQRFPEVRDLIAKVERFALEIPELIEKECKAREVKIKKTLPKNNGKN